MPIVHHWNRLVTTMKGPSCSWSYGSWIYNYLCNRCLSQITLRVKISFRRGVLDTILCDEVCQWLAACRWFPPGTPASTNKTDRHDITEKLLKVALNTINHKPNRYYNDIYLIWSMRYVMLTYTYRYMCIFSYTCKLR